MLQLAQVNGSPLLAPTLRLKHALGLMPPPHRIMKNHTPAQREFQEVARLVRDVRAAQGGLFFSLSMRPGANPRSVRCLRREGQAWS